jgi:hypothetical protein
LNHKFLDFEGSGLGLTYNSIDSDDETKSIDSNKTKSTGSEDKTNAIGVNSRKRLEPPEHDTDATAYSSYKQSQKPTKLKKLTHGCDRSQNYTNTPCSILRTEPEEGSNFRRPLRLSATFEAMRNGMVSLPMPISTLSSIYEETKFIGELYVGLVSSPN